MNPGTVLLLGLLVLVYLNFLGRRRAQRDRTALQQRLVVGAEVVTSSGLHASVTSVDDDGTVLLQIAPGQVTRWEKMAIGRVLSSPTDAATDVAATEEAEPPVVEPAVEPARPEGEPTGRALPDTAPPDRA